MRVKLNSGTLEIFKLILVLLFCINLIVFYRAELFSFYFFLSTFLVCTLFLLYAYINKILGLKEGIEESFKCFDKLLNEKYEEYKQKKE